MLYRPQRNYGCRVHDQYRYFGMRTLVLENDKLRISILLDKGSDIYEFLYKPRDLDIMWLTANGVQNPNRYLSTSPDPTATFIDYYEGGWQEVLPNGGPPSTAMGAQFGQHGEVAQMPWDMEIVRDTPEEVSVRLSVRTKKYPLLLRKTLTLTAGSSELSVSEELTNVGEASVRYMWGHHLAYGKPFLEPGCTIKLPDGVQVITEAEDSPVTAPGRIKRGVRHAWPMAEGRDGGPVDLSVLPERNTPSEIVYLTGFGKDGWYSVYNPNKGVEVKVAWDAEQFPYLWYWQEFGGTKDYPWYGRHYNIGLEPFTSYPTHGLEEAVRNGSAAAIQPGETKPFTLRIGVVER
jgi:galactose mutarotase-like enzyme